MNELAGKRILITRPAAQAAELVEKLAVFGAEAVFFPVIEIAPLQDSAALRQAITELESYTWVIFTSVNGVEHFWRHLADAGKGAHAFAHCKVAAIGPATAQALAQRGVQASFIPDEYISDAIAAGLGELRGQRVLLARADIARKTLAEDLRRLGAIPNEVAVYHIRAVQPTPAAWAQLEHGVDVLTFTSAATVKNFTSLLESHTLPILRQAVVACIGPVTASAAREAGWQVHVSASEYTLDGLVQSLLEYYKTKGNL